MNTKLNEWNSDKHIALRAEIKNVCSNLPGWWIIIIDENDINNIINLIENLDKYDWNLLNLIIKIKNWKIKINSDELDINKKDIKEKVSSLLEII